MCRLVRCLNWANIEKGWLDRCLTFAIILTVLVTILLFRRAEEYLRPLVSTLVLLACNKSDNEF
jgi:hypothetical protein